MNLNWNIERKKCKECKFHVFNDKVVHTQPVWIDHAGSTDPLAAKAAAQDLLRALDYAEGKFRESYGSAIPPGLVTRIGEARRRLGATSEM